MCCTLVGFQDGHMSIADVYQMNTAKTISRFWGCYICGYDTKTGVVRILVIFQCGPMFSHINGKLSPRPFE